MTKIINQKDIDFFINHLKKYHLVMTGREAVPVNDYFQSLKDETFDFPVFQVSTKNFPNIFNYYNPTKEVLNYCKNNNINYQPIEVSILINALKKKEYSSVSINTYNVLKEVEEIMPVSQQEKNEIVNNLHSRIKSFDFLIKKTQNVKNSLKYKIQRFSFLVAAELILNNDKAIDVKDFFQKNSDVEKVPKLLDYFNFCSDTSIYKEIKDHVRKYQKNITFVTQKDENLSLMKINKLDVINQFELSSQQVDMFFEAIKKKSSIVSNCYIEQNEISLFYKKSINLEDILTNVFSTIKNIKTREEIQQSLETIEQYHLLDSTVHNKAPDKSKKAKI